MGAMVAFECEYSRVETTHGTYPRGVPLQLRTKGLNLCATGAVAVGRSSQCLWLGVHMLVLKCLLVA